MRIQVVATVAGALAASALIAGAAGAQPSRLNDSQYLAAVRCEALMASPSLGKVDGSALAALIKDQSNRETMVLDRAEEVRDEVLSQARHADASGKAALLAERSGACQALAAAGSTGAAAMPAAGAN